MENEAEKGGFELLVVTVSGDTELDSVIEEHESRGWAVERIVPAREAGTYEYRIFFRRDSNKPHSGVCSSRPQ